MLTSVAVLFSICISSISAGTYYESDSERSLFYAYGAYCDSDLLSSWTCKWCNHITGFSVDKIVETNGLQAFTGYDSYTSQIIISYRGTQNIENWLQDFDYLQQEYPDDIGVTDAYIHSGFYTSYVDLCGGGLCSAITSLLSKYPSSDVLVTGHSLGGAIAQVTGLQLKTSSTFSKYQSSMGSVYVTTFGSPRWASENLVNYYNTAIDLNWRIVNKFDVVPTVPGTSLGEYGYQHSATEIEYTEYDDSSSLTYAVCDGSGEDDECGYFFPSVKAHLHYFGYYEDCEDTTTTPPLDWGDVFVDIDGNETETDISTSSSTTQYVMTMDDLSTTDEDEEIIQIIKDELGKISKIVLIITAAVGWFLALLFLCLCIKERRKRTSPPSPYFQLHDEV